MQSLEVFRGLYSVSSWMSSRVKLEPLHVFSAAEEEDNLNEADYWDEHWWWPFHHLLPVLHRLKVLDQLHFPEEMYQQQQP